MPGPLSATIIIAFTSICFGMVPLFARALLETGLSPEAIALYRFGLALPLALYFLPRRPGTLRPFVAFTGVGIASGIGWTTYLDALDQVPVASAGVVYMSYPLFVVVLARLLVGQPVTGRAALGAGLVFAGAFIVNAPGSISGEQWLVLLSSLPAPVGFALIVVLVCTMGHELTALERWGALALGHVAGLLPAALFSDAGTLLPASSSGWAWIAGIAVVTATLPQILYTFVSRSVSAARASAAGAAELPTMLAVGWLAFGEAVGLRESVGALLVLAAIAVTPAVSPAGTRMPGLRMGAPQGRSRSPAAR